MFDIVETTEFEAWRTSLADERARSRIAGRIARVALGLIGDVSLSEAASANSASIMGLDTGSISPDAVGRSSSCCAAATRARRAATSIELGSWRPTLEAPMPTETKHYDVAEHLTHPDDQAELIADAVASGDAAVIRDALNIVSRARGMSRVARDAGVTREASYKALGPDGDPSMSTLLGVFGALGIKLSASAMSADGPARETSATP